MSGRQLFGIWLKVEYSNVSHVKQNEVATVFDYWSCTGAFLISQMTSAHANRYNIMRTTTHKLLYDYNYLNVQRCGLSNFSLMTSSNGNLGFCVQRWQINPVDTSRRWYKVLKESDRNQKWSQTLALPLSISPLVQLSFYDQAAVYE